MNPSTPSQAASVPPGAWRQVKDVARSFALSLQLLPQAVRWPLALAYLLARASDSVADAAWSAPHPQGANDPRWLALNELQAALQTPGIDLKGDGRWVQALLPHIPTAERRLLLRLPHWLQALRHMPEVDQQMIVQVCSTIVQGQKLDLQRFAMVHPSEPMQALATPAQLDEYTYLVAGCVGPFWTHICEAHLKGWRTMSLDRMVEGSLAYGQALQRLNILRDTPEDLAMGRCYWPQTELAALGFTPAELAAAVAAKDELALQRLRPLITAHSLRTRQGLSLGLVYSMAIVPWRLRAASALPALIGLRTLQEIETAGPGAWIEPVKVSRRFIRQLLWRLVWGGLSPAGLRQMALQLGANEIDLQKVGLDGTIQA